MKNELLKLRDQRHVAKTDKERSEIDSKINALSAKNPDAFASAMVTLARDTATRAEELTVREQINEILPAVSLAYIAKNYFGKTRQWLYQRINGSAVNGKPARLTVEEMQRLEAALKDIGIRLSSVRVAP